MTWHNLSDYCSDLPKKTHNILTIILSRLLVLAMVSVSYYSSCGSSYFLSALCTSTSWACPKWHSIISSMNILRILSLTLGSEMLSYSFRKGRKYIKLAEFMAASMPYTRCEHGYPRLCKLPSSISSMIRLAECSSSMSPPTCRTYLGMRPCVAPVNISDTMTAMMRRTFLPPVPSVQTQGFSSDSAYMQSSWYSSLTIPMFYLVLT